MNHENYIDEIQEVLQELEEENDVNVVFAVDVGSYAWGASNSNSDIDVGYMYHANDLVRYAGFDSVPSRLDEFKYEASDGTMIDFHGSNSWDIRTLGQALKNSKTNAYKLLMSDTVYFGGQAHTTWRDSIVESVNPTDLMSMFLKEGKGHYYQYIATVVKIDEGDEDPVKYTVDTAASTDSEYVLYQRDNNGEKINETSIGPESDEIVHINHGEKSAKKQMYMWQMLLASQCVAITHELPPANIDELINVVSSKGTVQFPIDRIKIYIDEKKSADNTEIEKNPDQDTVELIFPELSALRTNPEHHSQGISWDELTEIVMQTIE